MPLKGYLWDHTHFYPVSSSIATLTERDVHAYDLVYCVYTYTNVHIMYVDI
jgi:hypothetical protein